MNYERNMVPIKQIESLITHLNENIVIVEGKRDVIALKKIGVKANVLTFEKFTREKGIINEKDAVILTDFDEEGEVKKNIISSVLLEKGMVEHDEYRRKFKLLFGVKTIEEVPPVFEKLIKGD